MPKKKSTPNRGVSTLPELIELAEEMKRQQKDEEFLTIYFYQTKSGNQIKMRLGDTPAPDELRVIDVMNGSDVRELVKRSYRYLLRLKRLHGCGDSTLP